MPTTKRVVKKPIEEKFVPPVTEVVSESLEAETTHDEPEIVVPQLAVIPSVAEAQPTQIKWGLFYGGLLLLVLVMGFSGGLWWAYRTGLGMTSATPTPIPTVDTTPQPTPASLPQIDRGVITVEVLNASGIKGRANEVANQIKALGYKKGATGNAPLQTKSTLSVSENIATLSATMTSELQGIVPGVTMATTLLPGTNTLRIILGSE